MQHITATAVPSGTSSWLFRATPQRVKNAVSPWESRAKKQKDSLARLGPVVRVHHWVANELDATSCRSACAFPLFWLHRKFYLA